MPDQSPPTLKKASISTPVKSSERLEFVDILRGFAVYGILVMNVAGFSGQAIVERTDIYEKIHPWVEKNGTLAILILAAIPNPFFDLAGVAAGITKLPMIRFLIACWIGQTIKMTAFAYAGAASLNWLFS